MTLDMGYQTHAPQAVHKPIFKPDHLVWAIQFFLLFNSYNTPRCCRKFYSVYFTVRKVNSKITFTTFHANIEKKFSTCFYPQTAEPLC